MFSTNHHFGESFINNCEITFSELLDCYFSDCDVRGKPLEGKYMVFNKTRGQWKSAELTEEFVEKTPLAQLILYIKELIKLDA